MIGNAHAPAAALDMAEALLVAVGEVVRLDSESQMDAVTGLSGSGPAYVFHMIECMAAAGETQGLAPNLAMQLAKATVAGAGALAMQSNESPEQLRINVTSPNGTTQAGLEVLMDTASGLPPLIKKNRRRCRRPLARACQWLTNSLSTISSRWKSARHRHARRTLPRSAQTCYQALDRFRPRNRRT